MSISSDELNFLVYRYLLESGFSHTAFSFGYESFVNKSSINGNAVPPGALISFVQKGLQYLELEANLNDSGTGVEGDFAALTPAELICKDVRELKQAAKERKGTGREAEGKGGKEEGKGKGGKEGSKVKKEKDKDKEKDKEKEKESKKEKENGGAVPMDTEMAEAEAEAEVPENVTVLKGHLNEVFNCAWNPNIDSKMLLASGSGDATARIWEVAEGPCGKDAQGKREPLILTHKSDGDKRDVTALDWNKEGTRLATGSYDGKARIWSTDGTLLNTLEKHKGPIFSLKFTKSGLKILTGSVDTTCIIWDALTGELVQEFKCHSKPALDVDWRSEDQFATCSTDRVIFVCELGKDKPIKKFAGHSNEVNAIKWDPSGEMLASCSDDCTIKIWDLDNNGAVKTLKGHTKEIYTIRWRPSGDPVLASASFDSTIKIWNIETGLAYLTLRTHTDPVYSIAFSPDGNKLASGSFDKRLLVWDLKEGKTVSQYDSKGGIFEVCWNEDGSKVAACHANGVVSVIDVDREGGSQE